MPGTNGEPGTNTIGLGLEFEGEGRGGNGAGVVSGQWNGGGGGGGGGYGGNGGSAIYTHAGGGGGYEAQRWAICSAQAAAVDTAETAVPEAVDMGKRAMEHIMQTKETEQQDLPEVDAELFPAGKAFAF